MMSTALKTWLLAADSDAPTCDIRAELLEMADSSNCQKYWADIDDMLHSDSPQERKRGKVRCRLIVMGALAEWLQMHDLHEPFAMGPPSKNQACAKVDDPMTSQERCECGKLYPRCLLAAVCGKIAEDPRRRELYRIWLARNCHFINNFAPLLLFATDSNMDIQAVTTKF